MLLITTINEMYSLVPAVVWTTASSLLQDSISPETLEIAHRSTEHKTRGQASGHGFRRFLTGSNGALALASMCPSANSELCFHLRKAGGLAIRLCEPDAPAAKILDQPLILIRGHLSRPDDLGMIDVGLVVYPFVERIVIRSIAHDYQMASGHFI
jgi:hypothetical protein